MTSQVYEAIAFAMRYWFIIAMIVILLAVIIVSVKEYKTRKTVITRMEEFLGYIEIVYGNDDLIGAKYGICDENIIGSSQSADICINDDSIKKTHAMIYRKGEDLYLSVINKASVLVNGSPAEKAYTLKTGDIVSLGNIDVCIFLKRKRVGDDY